jgi:hypothetical protein
MVIMKKIVLNKNMKKSIVLILLLLVSCSSMNDKYFEMLKGEWQITKFYHKEKNIGSDGDYLIGFEKHNQSWFMNVEDRTDKFISFNYEVFKDLDTLRMGIKNCEDKRFDGVYNLSIDTIQDTREQYMIQLTLDSKNSYIQAIRPKLKYANPSE